MKKYELVADKIKAYITKNKLHHGDKLPTITELMKEYQVGKSTILQAITLLTQRGIVYKVQGSGVFVRQGEMVICHLLITPGLLMF